MRFADIFNHNETKKHLVQLVKENRLSHALLFLGKDGTGGLPLARAFAQYLVCEKVSGALNTSDAPSLFGDAIEVVFPDDACGACPACLKAAQLMHPDIHFTFPVVPEKAGHIPVSSDFISDFREWIKAQPYGNAFDWLQYVEQERKIENKQGNITAKECEIILHNMNLKSYESSYKIQIIWMPEALGSMGNKLLKMIEEPPVDSLFILVAQDESQILPTILSRTQLIKIPTPTKESLANALMEKNGTDRELAWQIASIVNGNYHEALQLLENPNNDWENLIRDWMNSVVRRNPEMQGKFIEQFAKLGREKQKHLLRFFIQILEHTLQVLVIGEEKVAHKESASVHEIAVKLSKMVKVEQIEAMMEITDESIYHIERNANPKILAQALCIRFIHIIYNKSLILVQ